MDNFFQTAFDEENPEVDTPEVTEPEVVEPEETHTPTDESAPVEPQVDTPQTYEINGEQITLEELQRGYMRQSDYTKKTQLLAQERKASEQQVEPTQQYANPFEQRIVELEQRLADKELDDTITTLKQKYPDFDEVKVLNTAYEKGITDLEFVYKSTREIKASEPVDMEAIKAQIRAELMQELSATKDETVTLVSQSSTPLQASTPKLSERESYMAKEFGLTEDEYMQYK